TVTGPWRFCPVVVPVLHTVWFAAPPSTGPAAEFGSGCCPAPATHVRRAWHARGMPEPALITVVVGDEELLVDRAVAAVVAKARAAEPDADVHDLMPSQVGL